MLSHASAAHPSLVCTERAARRHHSIRNPPISDWTFCPPRTAMPLSPLLPGLNPLYESRRCSPAKPCTRLYQLLLLSVFLSSQLLYSRFRDKTKPLSRAGLNYSRSVTCGCSTTYGSDLPRIPSITPLLESNSNCPRSYELCEC